MANLQELLGGMAESSLLSTLNDYASNRNSPDIYRNVSKSGIDPTVWSWYDTKIGGGNPQDVINTVGDAERLKNQSNPQLAREAELYKQGKPVNEGQVPIEEQQAPPLGTLEYTEYLRQKGASLGIQGMGGTQQPVPTTPVSNYAGPSVVDYLNSIGQPSDVNSRRLLAQKMGIQNYDPRIGSKNTELLNSLRAGQAIANPNVNTSSTPPVLSSAPPQAPSIGVDASLLGQYGLSTPNPQQSPMKSFTDTYKELLSNLGVPDIKEEFDKVQKEYDNLQNELNDKISDINDNPWLSEGVRVKQIRSLQDRYEGKTGILTNKLNLYNSLYEQGVDEAKFVAQNAYAQYQFEVGTQLKLYELGQKQLDAERSLTQQAFENTLAVSDRNRKIDEFDLNYALDRERLAIDRAKAEEKDSNKLKELLSVDEATKLGVPYGTTKGGAVGLQSSKGSAQGNFTNLLSDYSTFLGQHSAFSIATQPTLKATKNSLVSQLTAEYKQMKQLGTLDAGVQKLIDGLLGQGGLASFSSSAQKTVVDQLISSFSPGAETGGSIGSYLNSLGY